MRWQLFYSKPGPERFLFGLCFLVLCGVGAAINSFGQELLPVVTSRDFGLCVPSDICSDSQSFSVALDYQPFLYEWSDSPKDTCYSRVGLVRIHGMRTLRGQHSSLGMYFSVARHNGTYCRRSEDYRVTARTRTSIVLVGSEFSIGPVDFYLHTGGMRSPQFMNDSMYVWLRDRPQEWFWNGPWFAAVSPRYQCRAVTLRARVSSAPVVSYAGRLINRTTGNYRSFPLSFHRKRVALQCSAHTTGVGFDLRAATYRLKTSRWIYPDNAMPSHAEVIGYMGGGGVTVHGFLCDTLRMGLRASITGGRGIGYDAALRGYEYFRMDSLRVRHGVVYTQWRIKGGIDGHMKAGMLNAVSPRGHYKLSSFSPWSVFAPQDYKYSNARVQYREIGMRLDKTIDIQGCSMEVSLHARYFETYAGAHLQKKKVIINLLPIYESLGEKQYWDVGAVMCTPQLSLMYRKKRLRLKFQLRQHIPWILDGTTRGESQPWGKSVTTGNRVWGGTTLGMHLQCNR